MDYKTVIASIIKNLVVNSDNISLDIKEDEKKVTIAVTGDSNDISRLIGKKGVMANSIRELINVAGILDNSKFVKVIFMDNGANKATDEVNVSEPSSNETNK